MRILDIHGRLLSEEFHRDLSLPVSLIKYPSGHYIIEITSEESGYMGIAKVAKIDN